MDARTEKLLSHPLMLKEDPKISQVVHRIASDSTVIVQAKVENAEAAYLFYKPVKLGRTYKVDLQDTGENGDAMKDDLTYSVELDKDLITHYFIVAEGEKTAKTHPEKASYEMLKILK